MTEAGGTSLVTGSENIEPLIDNQPQKNQDKFGIKAKAVFAFLVLLSLTIMAVSFASEKNVEDYDVMPTKIRMLLPPQEPFLLKIGESRVLDVVFYSGYDDRTIDDYKSVNKREIHWDVSPSGIVEVDMYGTLTTLKVGEVNVTVRSHHIDSVVHSKTIRIVEEYPAPLPQQTRIINSQVKVPLNLVLQKRITFFTKAEALNVQNLPQTIKDYILNLIEAEPKIVVKQGNTVWTITDYADGSKRSFLTRVNPDELNERDRTMYFIGNRYIPGDGFDVSLIADDKQMGVWVVNKQGEVSHIEMIHLSYKEKAYQMSKNTEEFVMRHGLASDSSFNGKNWVPAISDNDGLWTSMYAVGELMRYASLRSLATSTPEQIAAARKSALKPLKAVLLIANVPCRDKTIDARIRHFKNTRLDYQGSFLSKQFLIQNRSASTDSYPGSPADGVGLFGIQAGTNIGDVYLGGKKRYTQLPINKSDWSKDSTTHIPATTKRKLKGFWARTFVIEALDGPPPTNDGLFFKHNNNKTQTVLSRADLLYDYNATQHPILDLGSQELPQVLKGFLNINKAQYYKQDLIYKGDTSFDQVIGHLFVYKVAYDILLESDPQEKSVKDLIRNTVVSFCTHLTNNGYNHIDATGQGTKWGKLARQFLLSDFTLQDGPLDALQLMLCFKLCYYMTGEQRWKRQYQFLIHDESFRYLDLVSLFWKRWRYRAFNQDASPSSSFYHMKEDIKYDEEEVIRHMFHSLNFSDDEQAFLAFYLAFQLEDNPEYLKMYKEGIDSFWVLISRSQNPLWYFMYQLTNPKEVIKDYYGNNILEVASWHLSRTNIETRTTAAFVEGSRKDVLVEGKEELSQCSVNPQKIIGHRKHKTDALAVKRLINSKIDPSYDPINIYDYKPLPSDERSIHKFNGGTLENIYSSDPNGMEAATVYTLPYWFGVYHKMIDISENSQQ